ncbi:winged helix-turn-helix transcriptional regulator [Cupriavidus basilensis]
MDSNLISGGREHAEKAARQCALSHPPAAWRGGRARSILILREAFYGASRFDDFQKQLGIAPNMLARRLETLVREDLLERRQVLRAAAALEYLLTARGREFRPVMLALLAWGNRHSRPRARACNWWTGIPAPP